jgi:Tfp pilus assembly protein PilZ
MGGVFIKTEKISQYIPGDEIDLITKFPIRDEAMMLKGQVARVSDEGIGVRFTGLNPNQADVIGDCISSYRDWQNAL